MAYLNGYVVDDSVIDPAEHRFIGLFRHPAPPNPKGCDIWCVCGDTLQTVGAVRTHWSQGCFDVPQYVSIEQVEGVPI